jgi:hypothetical protein
MCLSWLLDLRVIVIQYTMPTFGNVKRGAETSDLEAYDHATLENIISRFTILLITCYGAKERFQDVDSESVASRTFALCTF